MRIGELARVCGVSRDTIRYYEKRRLLPAPARSETGNQYRTYTELDCRRLGIIRYAKGLGFTLREIQPVLEDWLAGDVADTAKCEALRVKLGVIDEALEELLAQRRAICVQLSARA